MFILSDWLSGVLFKSFQDALTDTTYTGGLNNKYPFLTILEIEKSKIKALADCVCWELASWFIDGCLPDVSSHGGKDYGACGVSYKSTSPIHEHLYPHNLI